MAGGNSISHLLSGEQYCGGGKVSLFWFYTKILFHRGYGFNSHAPPLPWSAGWAGSELCWHVIMITHNTDGVSVSATSVSPDGGVCHSLAQWFSPLLCLCPPVRHNPGAAICWEVNCWSTIGQRRGGRSRACNHLTLTSFHLQFSCSMLMTNCIWTTHNCDWTDHLTWWWPQHITHHNLQPVHISSLVTPSLSSLSSCLRSQAVRWLSSCISARSAISQMTTVFPSSPSGIYLVSLSIWHSQWFYIHCNQMLVPLTWLQ